MGLRGAPKGMNSWKVRYDKNMLKELVEATKFYNELLMGQLGHGYDSIRNAMLLSQPGGQLRTSQHGHTVDLAAVFMPVAEKRYRLKAEFRPTREGRDHIFACFVRA